MEDHLKNKNRLEKEWEALCAYQAEPNDSAVAQQEENVQKNRSRAVVPCMYTSLCILAFWVLDTFPNILCTVVWKLQMAGKQCGVVFICTRKLWLQPWAGRVSCCHIRPCLSPCKLHICYKSAQPCHITLLLQLCCLTKFHSQSDFQCWNILSVQEWHL